MLSKCCRLIACRASEGCCFTSFLGSASWTDPICRAAVKTLSARCASECVSKFQIDQLNHSLTRRDGIPGRFSSVACLVAAILCVLLNASLVEAQEEDQAPEANPLAIVDGLLQAQQKIYIQSKDGRPLMNYTLEELRELEKVYRESKQMPAVLSSADVKAEIKDGAAEIKADYSVQLSRSGTIERLDLGLKNCQLIDDPKFESDDSPAVKAEYRVLPTQDGYQWLVLSPEPGKHRLSVTSQTVVDRSVDRHNLTIDLPIVNCVIRVTLPANAVEERVRLEDVIINRAVDASGVQLEVRSRGGSFTLDWRLGRTTERVGAVEAESETVYEPLDVMDSTQFWSATTTLNLRWYGDDGNTKVRIALPVGAQWNSLPYSEFDRFRLTTVLAEPVADADSGAVAKVEAGTDASAIPETGATQTGAGDAAASSEPQRVEVLEIENLEPSEFPEVEDLKLQWRWLPAQKMSDRSMVSYTVPAPVITGTDRHDAKVGVVFPRAMELTYQANPSVRVQRRNLAEDSGFGRQQIQFAFPDAPADVSMTFRKQQLLPTLRTTYRVHVGESQLELTAWIEGWFEGVAAELGVVPGQWVIDEQSSFALRDPNSAYTDDTTALSVRRTEDGKWIFSSREENSGEPTGRTSQVWRFKAYRKWDVKSGQEIQFDFPLIDRGIASGQPHLEHGSGLLLVSSDQSLALQSDSAACAGLFAEAMAGEYQNYLTTPSQTATAYRFQSLSAAPKWVGSAMVLAQQIRLGCDVEVDVRESQAKIRQNFDLQVSNRALIQPKMRVRSDVLPIQISMGDLLISYVEQQLSDATVQVDGTNHQWREIQLTGLPAVLGSARLTVESSVPLPPVGLGTGQLPEQSKSQQAESRVSLPLVTMQLENEVARSPVSLSVRSSRNIDVLLATDNSAVSLTTSNAARPLEMEPDQDSFELILRYRSSSNVGRLVTQGVWLQTLLAGTDRRDRFVARVRSESGQVVVQLPDQSQLDKVALDGVLLTTELAPYDYNTNRVVVALPDTGEHCVEAVYTLSEPLSWAHRLRLKPAVIEDAQPQDRCYWQLVMPGIFHLGWCPPELTAEWRWQWSSLWWSRVSDKDQSALERLLGAQILTRIPTNTNSYTMSGLGDLPVAEVWVLSRFFMWLPMGLLTLFGSWLLLSFPVLRSPHTLIAVALILLSGAMIWPDMSMLLGQTAVITFLLVGIISLTRYAVDSRVRRRSVLAARPSSY